MAALLAACTFTIDEGELGGGRELSCSDKQKLCDVQGTARCVSLDDPSFGCARRNCIPCNLPKATAICSPATGECVVGACSETWEDCDRMNDSGCEVNTANDVNHCGKCGERCPPKQNAEAACGNSSCYIRRCDEGYDCNGDFEDGCEVDLMSDANNCGTCGRVCEGTCLQGECEPDSRPP